MTSDITKPDNDAPVYAPGERVVTTLGGLLPTEKAVVDSYLGAGRYVLIPDQESGFHTDRYGAALAGTLDAPADVPTIVGPAPVRVDLDDIDNADQAVLDALGARVFAAERLRTTLADLTTVLRIMDIANREGHLDVSETSVPFPFAVDSTHAMRLPEIAADALDRFNDAQVNLLNALGRSR